MVVAFAMGLTTDRFINLIQDGRFSFDEGDFHISIESNKEDLNEENVSNMEKVESCHSMEIEFGAGILEIYYDDVEEIQVKQNHILNLKTEVKNGVLYISDQSKLSINFDNETERKLVLILPRNMNLKEVEIEIGASKADIKDIQADELNIKVGAGPADVSNVVAEKIEVGVGAGQINVSLQGGKMIITIM